MYYINKKKKFSLLLHVLEIKKKPIHARKEGPGEGGEEKKMRKMRKQIMHKNAKQWSTIS